MIQGNSLAIWRKVKLDPQLFPAYIRTNSKSIKTLNKIPKLQYITLVESSTEDYFYNLNVKKAFLTVAQNSESVKGKTDTGDLHKHQELLHGKNYHKQDQWEILLLLIQRMGLISLTYKEFLHFKRKRLIIQQRCGKGYGQAVYRKEIQMAFIHMKTYSPSLE